MASANPDGGPENSSASAEEAASPLRALRSRLKRFVQRDATAARVPDGTRVYAVGDIHGRADLLDQLMAAILKDAAAGPDQQVLICIGDYVDRGPDSKGVIDRLLALPEGFEVHFLRGNHDQAVLDFLSEPGFYRVWRSYGGPETLLSYGVRPPLYDDDKAIGDARDAFAATLPQRHRTFLEGLPLAFQCGDYYFVHAGVRPGVPLDKQSPEDLMWIRDDFLLSRENFGKVIVHGHTPAESPVCRPNRIGIDTGAYATGRLTALVLEGADVRFLHAE